MKNIARDWRYPKMGVPQVTIGVNTQMVIHDLDDLIPPISGHSQMYIAKLGVVVSCSSLVIMIQLAIQGLCQPWQFGTHLQQPTCRFHGTPPLKFGTILFVWWFGT